MKINENLLKIKSNIPKGVKLVVVSKNQDINKIKEIYNFGQRDFGENRPQELKEKHFGLFNDINWHFIGHLQKNKVKYIAPFVNLIHSVDSLELLEVIQKEAEKNKRNIDVLLQVYIANEETKFGLSEEELYLLCEKINLNNFPNIKVCGLMGMATFTDNKIQIKEEFTHLKSFFEICKLKYFKDKYFFKELSMGMSSDYLIAIECGSTILRIGSEIFKE